MTHRLRGAAFAAALAAAAPAFAADSSTTGTAAYPNNPSGTPQTGNAGAPVITDKAACPTPGKCPDKPAPSGQADAQAAEVPKTGVPATAYPNSPAKTPAADPSGTAPN